MLRIECPWCGVRDEEEFTYGGPADRKRPETPSELSDEQWSAYLFNRENPRGDTQERWRHTYGCRRWFICERDTLTHVVKTVRRFVDIGVPVIPQSSALDSEGGYPSSEKTGP